MAKYTGASDLFMRGSTIARPIPTAGSEINYEAPCTRLEERLSIRWIYFFRDNKICLQR